MKIPKNPDLRKEKINKRLKHAIIYKLILKQNLLV
jgi:hypothetical protein